MGFPVPAEAQVFKPFTRLRVIETRYFDIIFPEKSAPTAEKLLRFVDDDFERVSALLGIAVRDRIPVVVTPDTDRFNGYMNPVPYPHIVLYDTPMDPEWTSFRNSLESLFLHELTHVISLGSRDTFYRVLHSIFGAWVIPTGLTTPLFMVEGVTVSFESLDGFGRANDPLTKQRIRQAIREGTLLSPFQASGIYDLPPSRRSYYEYGGLFSAYLQRTYGLDAYRELWQALGSVFPKGKPISLSFDVYKTGFYAIFESIYARDIHTAWADFAAELTLADLANNPIPPVNDGESLISAVVARKGLVYFLDTIQRRVFAYDPASGSIASVIQTDSTSYDMDVHPDGSRILVGGYRYEGALAKAVSVEYETATGKRTGRTWQGIYKPRYFGDRIVGIDSDLHTNRLVVLGESGEKRVLLSGNAECLFSNPSPIDENRIVFVVAERGIRRLGIYDMAADTASILVSDLPDDQARWRYIRDLRVSEGKAYFSYNHDDRMYKLGYADILNPNGTSAFFAEKDFSGGVFAPAEAEGRIIYKGSFSTWDSLMAYPEPIAEASGLRTAVRWMPWSVPEEGSAGGPDEGPKAGPRTESAWRPPTIQDSRRYSPIRYLNPLKFWIPLPLVRSEPNKIRVDGGGVLSFLSDPTDQNTFLINAGGDLVGAMGYFDITWASAGLGFPLSINLSDRMETPTTVDVYSYRASRGSISAVWDRGLGDESLRLRLSPFAVMALFADNPRDGSSAYMWTYEKPFYSVGLSAGLSTLRRFPWQLFGQGVAGELSLRSPLNGFAPRIDGVVRFAFESELPIRGTLYAAYDAQGMSLTGESSRYGPAPFADVAAHEYAGQSLRNTPWLVGGEAEIKLFSVESQTNLSHLYFNRLFGTLAYRGAIFETPVKAVPSAPTQALYGNASLVQSVLVRAGAVVSGTPLTMVPLRFTPHVWGAWKLSNLGDGDPANNFQVGIAFSLEW